MDFKTNTIRELYEKTTRPPTNLRTIPKDLKAINLGDILERFNEDVSEIIEDITENGLKVILDSKALEFYRKEADGTPEKQEIIDILEGISKKIGVKLEVDIQSITELDSNQLDSIKEHCELRRVHVNDGWDKSANIGNSIEDYTAIVRNAKKMFESLGLTDDLTEQQKFDKIYEYVVANISFDYNGTNDKFTLSRGVYGFFQKHCAVCAGNCLGIIQLCKMAGIECEYVQGKATSPKGKEESHSWIRVKIDGQWYNCDPTWDITNQKKMNKGQHLFKQLSDDKFCENGMHVVDNSYNPTFIRGDAKYRNFREQKSYETANDESKNTLVETKKIEKLYLTETKGQALKGGAKSWFKGLATLTADIITLFTGTGTSKIPSWKINQLILNNATGLTAEQRAKYKKMEERLKPAHDKKIQDNEQKKQRKKQNSEQKIQEKQNKKKTLKKDEQSYKNPEEMSKVEIDREINEIKNKIDRMNGDYSKIDYDALEGAEALRYLRGELEFSRATETLIELKGKRVDNIADRIVELADKNWDEGLTNQDIEEFKLLADISQQIARIKRQPIDQDSTEKVAELCHGTIDKLQLEEITRVIDKAVVKSTISKKEVELGIKSSEESRSPRMRKILASSKNYEAYMKKTQKYLDELDRKLEKQMKEEAATKKKAAKERRISPEIPDGVTRPEPQAKGSEWHDSLRRGSNNKTQIDKSGEKGVPGEDDSVTKRPEPKDPDEWEV